MHRRRRRPLSLRRVKGRGSPQPKRLPTRPPSRIRRRSRRAKRPSIAGRLKKKKKEKKKKKRKEKKRKEKEKEKEEEEKRKKKNERKKKRRARACARGARSAQVVSPFSGRASPLSGNTFFSSAALGTCK